MTYRAQGIPLHAEALEVDAAVSIEKKPSRFAPPLQQLVTKIKCPACQTEQEYTLLATRCTCGLWIKIDDKNAWVWRDRKDIKPALVTSLSMAAIALLGSVIVFGIAAIKPGNATSTPAPFVKDQSRMVQR